MDHIHEILYNVIFTYLEFYDKHTFQKMNKYTNKIHIKNLYDIDEIYLGELDDKIIKKYRHVTKLNAKNNFGITNINHMTKLKELNASESWGVCRIGDDSLVNLTNLEILNAYDNRRITNVNHMTNLKELDASFTCGISDEGIKQLKKIKILTAIDNYKITNINRVTKLIVSNIS